MGQRASGSALPGEQTMQWQGRQVTGGLTGFNAWIVRVLRIDPVKSQQKSLDRLKVTTEDVARISLKKYNAKWFREFFAYDPAPDFARIRVPVLAITGEKDIQVNPADLERMLELIPGDIETHRLPGVTHLMRSEGTKPSLRGHKEQVRRLVDPRLIELVANWLEKGKSSW
ncbi:alpha/beta hydrolase [Ferrimicrobium acidiphilum]|nr:alpha/beta hydrolase [Ferrimicrobium acidiphilum]